MTYDWDDDKNATNRRRHGLDFADAPLVFEGLTLTAEDDRRDYGEVRYNTLGTLEGRVVQITTTERGDVTRIISMRKATKNEQKIYFERIYGRKAKNRE